MFIAHNFDVHRGRANYSSDLHQANPNIWLTWGRSVRALPDLSSLETWLIDHPEYELERFFLHYKQDVTLDTPDGPLAVKGWRAECSPNNCTPPATALTEAVSRLPDISGDGYDWLVPNPLYSGLLDFYAFTMHQRHDWYDDYEGVFWDWCAGATVHVGNQLSKTHEYADIPDDSYWSHPYIADSISVIDRAHARYRELYPSDPVFEYTPCNTIANFLTYDHPGQPPNEYRSNLLASDEVTHFFYEVWMGFDEDDAPSNRYPNVLLHLKYLRDTITLSQQKKIILQVMPFGDVASDREKLFLLSLEYLVQNPERFVLAYHLEGEDHPDNPDDSVANWLWVPAMGYDIGLPEINPDGVQDVFGNSGTSEMYEWLTGNDPGNPGRQYSIYARQYENALVLTKLRQTTDSTWGENTQTVHSLSRLYRPLNVDGTLGALTNTVALKNNEGVILVESQNYPPFLPPIKDKIIHEREELHFTIVAYDGDPADMLSFTSEDLPEGATLTDHHDRTATFSWTPTDTQVGDYDVTVTVDDGTDQTSQSFGITVLDGAAGCAPNWSCGEWGQCVDGLQTRLCQDLEDCGTDAGRPDEIRLCDSEPPAQINNLIAS